MTDSEDLSHTFLQIRSLMLNKKSEPLLYSGSAREGRSTAHVFYLQFS